ncbi:MAG TPA: integrin alpha, partial [Candidatus Eisenbacteria bacterium]|nr:integrin alpha [Candidatus Eisenbacteria bacterium]
MADVEFYFVEPGAQLGFSVSDAGDVNADGFADVIVGAPHHATGAGRAYVYFGGTGGDYYPDMLLVGGPGDQHGASVSGAGDVNADGYDDVIVGAIASDVGTNVSAGRVFVYYGGPAPDPIEDLVQPGSSPSDQMGFAVSGAGDVNGDGYADFIVGTNQLFFRGQALVLTSRAYDLETPNGGEQWVVGSQHDVSWLGSNPADLWLSSDGGLTYSLLASNVGGLDRNEFSITAPAVPTSTAKVRLSIAGEPLTHATSYASETFFSIVAPHDPPAAAHRLQRTFAGTNSEDALGASVSDAGDVNGDGYGDVIVGAYANDVGGSDAGRAYVHYGGPAADAIPDLTLTGAAAGDNFGISVSGAGDVNGDGYADVIVGAWTNSVGGSSAGRAYLYFGGPGADA